MMVVCDRCSDEPQYSLGLCKNCYQRAYYFHRRSLLVDSPAGLVLSLVGWDDIKKRGR